MKKAAVPLSFGLLLVGLATSCANEPPLTAGRTVDIQMSEFHFNPPEPRLKAGETVTLTVINRGAVDHEFMLGRDSSHGDGYERDFLRGVRTEVRMSQGSTFTDGDHGKMMLIQPGGKGELTMKVPPDRKGEWEMGCFLPGHYQAGMKGKVLIE